MLSNRTGVAVGLVACALIVLQISFTRLISYKLFYHFVFLAIALALLGLGAAGTYVAVRKEPADLDSSTARWLAVLAVLTPCSLLAMASPPITSEGALTIKLLGADAMKYLAFCSLFMVALNFAGGVVLAQAFKQHSAHMGKLYACDLLGSAVGCLLTVAAMKYLSPPAAFLFASPLALIALAPLVQRARDGRWSAAAGVLGVALSLGVAAGPARASTFRNFGLAPGAAAKEQILKYEWNHIIRTDHTPRGYVLDGEASTPLIRWDQAQQQTPVFDPAYMIGKPNPEVGIIGFGGGPQVAEARRAKAAHITAVDINPSIAGWVTGEDRAHNLDLFVAPHIDVINAEGRHTVRQHPQAFDVLVMHAIDTYAATSAGAYALTENFLYTKEAIIDFLGALKEDGVMSIQRWLFNPPRENMRLFATALSAFEALGYAEPERHVMMVAPIDDYERVRSEYSRIWGYLLISPSPFDESQIARMREHVQRLNWSVLYAPGGNERSPFAEYVRAAGDRQVFRDSYPYVIEPVTDASPYLFQFYDPLDPTTWQVEADWATSGIYQSSAVTLLVTLLVAVLASLLLIIVPLAWASLRARKHAQARLGLRRAVYFACLGIGFMALEVPLTQLLGLYLGHPVYGFSVVLVALLVATGVGSLLSQRFAFDRFRICALIAALLLALSVAVLPLIHGTIHWPDPVRFAIALSLVLMCGLPMGFPLALAVREAGAEEPTHVAWAWGINGAASVVGSCLVMVVMVFGGTLRSLTLGAACYALAWSMRLGRSGLRRVPTS